MAQRQLIIPPFELVDGSNPEVEVEIMVVDPSNPKNHYVNPLGNGVLDSLELRVHEQERRIWIWPNSELVPAGSVYRCRVVNNGKKITAFETVVHYTGEYELPWKEFCGF